MERNKIQEPFSGAKEEDVEVKCGNLELETFASNVLSEIEQQEEEEEEAKSLQLKEAAGDWEAVVEEEVDEEANKQSRNPLHFCYRNEIDGVRALAVAAVLLFHVQVPCLSNGYVGVDVFFVLSGFLVLSLLFREWATAGKVDVLHFYARRVRRLFPASLACLLGVGCTVVVLFNAVRAKDTLGGVSAASLYASNWYFLKLSTDYWHSEEAETSPVVHFWSLSAEEQFYIVIGLLAWMASRRVSRMQRRISTGLGVLCAGIVAAVWVLPLGETTKHFSTVVRVYQFSVGGVLASELLHLEESGGVDPSRFKLLSILSCLLMWIGLLVLLGTASSLNALLPFSSGLISSLSCFLFLLGNEMARQLPSEMVLLPVTILWSFLRTHIMVFLGEISYAIYLWHYPIVIFVDSLRIMIDPDSIASTQTSAFKYTAYWICRATTLGGLSVFMAYLSRIAVEQPFMRISLTKSRRKQLGLVLGGFLACLLLAGAFFIVMTSINPEEVHKIGSGDEKFSLALVTSRKLVLPTLVPAFSEHCQETAKEQYICTPNTTGHRFSTVMVVGDSHSRFSGSMWVQLSIERGFKLIHLSHPSCRLFYHADSDSCSEHWSRVRDTLESNSVDYLVGYSAWTNKTATAHTDSGEDIVLDHDSLEESKFVDLVFNVAFADFLSSVGHFVKHKVFLVRQEPSFQEPDMTDCLLEHESDTNITLATLQQTCSRRRDERHKQFFNLTAKMKDAANKNIGKKKAKVVDVAPIYCPTGVCEALFRWKDGVYSNRWRDWNHPSEMYQFLERNKIFEEVFQSNGLQLNRR